MKIIGSTPFCLLFVLMLGACASSTSEYSPTQGIPFNYIGKVLEGTNGSPCTNFDVELRDTKHRNSIFNFEASPPVLAKSITDKDGMFKMTCPTHKESYVLLIRKVGRSSMVFSPVSVTGTNLIYYTTVQDPVIKRLLDDAIKQKQGGGQ